MAPSEPVFVATTPSGLWALDSVYRSAHQTLGTLVFLSEETIYLGTSKHYSVVSVRVNKESIAHMSKCDPFTRNREERGMGGRARKP